MKINTIPLGMVNAYLLKGESIILVDTGISNGYKRLINGVNQAGFDMNEISLVIITHSHSDHFGNAAKLQRDYQVPVAIHESSFRENEMIQSSPAVAMSLMPKLLNKMFGFMKTPLFIPDLPLKDGMTLEDYGVEGRIVHSPGHTEDTISIVIGNEIIIGDALNSTKSGTFKMPMYCNDIEKLKSSILALKAFEPKKLYCSHSDVINKGFDKLYKWCRS